MASVQRQQQDTILRNSADTKVVRADGVATDAVPRRFSVTMSEQLSAEKTSSLEHSADTEVALSQPATSGLRSVASISHVSRSGRRSSCDTAGSRRSSWHTAQDVYKAISFTHALKTLRDTVAEDVNYHIDLVHQATIGEGAFGVVECCMYLPQKRPVAVKKLKFHERLTAADILDMMREIALMKKLRSPYVVEFIGSGCYMDQLRNKVHFLVEEYVDGGTLKAMVTKCINTNQRLYTMEDGVRWLTDIAKGLQYLHESIPMVIHRDMKLDNVLLKGRDPHTSRAKICDLGLSTLIRPTHFGAADLAAQAQGGAGPGPGSEAPSAPRAPQGGQGRGRRTSTMMVQEWAEHAKARTVVKEKEKEHKAPRASALKIHNEGDRLEGRIGTWLYMAPEVYRQELYCEKADVFSFGIIAYEILHRYRMSMAVANAEEAQIYARRVATRQFRPPMEELVPKEFQDIIKQCWHADAKARPSMASVVKMLQEASKTADWGPYNKAEEDREKASAGCRCCIQ